MSNSTETKSHTPVRAEHPSPGYWRVTFDNPPLNLYEPEMETALAAVVDQLEADPNVKVVVFDSALPDFFIPARRPSELLERAFEYQVAGRATVLPTP
jgi:enoyl-CoA hydratase/carnithine racemase